MSAESEQISNMSRDEMMSALFANMVFQNTNMAVLFMGRVPHPQTGEKTVDLEAARMFIDQLEMLQVKTKGNLSKDEEKLLQQSLMHVRMAFVETIEKGAGVAPAEGEGQAAEAKPAETASAPPTPSAPAPDAAAQAAADEESRKRFSKKY